MKYSKGIHAITQILKIKITRLFFISKYGEIMIKSYRIKLKIVTGY